MATSASDVLAVALLQRECGTPEARLLRVAPLFERLADLEAAPAVLRRLFSIPWYREHLRTVRSDNQEVMIGYSDSGKDAGRMSAAWALYEGQEAAVGVGSQFGVKITLFHGRGGTVGRGGGPAHLAILSQPAGTINGRLRVTIQGEIIETDFGEHEMCFRTLDLYTAATLEHSLLPPAGPEPEWRETMALMSKVSCAQYRDIVFNEPKFIRYFHAATPAGELGRMNIGSRPAKRKPNAGVESLRAIPWIFAWTQTRLQLPVWLGIGAAFEAASKQGRLPMLQTMYRDWPFFKVTLDMVEMVLAKADPRITELYDQASPPLRAASARLRPPARRSCCMPDSDLVSPLQELLQDEPELREFGAYLRELFGQTEKTLLQVTLHTSLLDGPAGAFGVLQVSECRAAPLSAAARLLLVYHG